MCRGHKTAWVSGALGLCAGCAWVLTLLSVGAACIPAVQCGLPLPSTSPHTPTHPPTRTSARSPALPAGAMFFVLCFFAFTSLTTVDLFMLERKMVVREVRGE